MQRTGGAWRLRRRMRFFTRAVRERPFFDRASGQLTVAADLVADYATYYATTHGAADVAGDRGAHRGADAGPNHGVTFARRHAAARCKGYGEERTGQQFHRFTHLHGLHRGPVLLAGSFNPCDFPLLWALAHKNYAGARPGAKAHKT